MYMIKYLMNKILHVLFLAWSFLFSQEANYQQISLCKADNGSINFDYIDSTHAISDIKPVVTNDTIDFKIYVLFAETRTDSYQMPVSAQIKYVQYGNAKLEVNQIDKCTKAYSGQDALEYLKKQKGQ